MGLNTFNIGPYLEARWKQQLIEMRGESWKPKYTFYSDFVAAELYGEKAIRATYKGVIRNWGNNYEALVEIILVLNHKIWNYFGENCIGNDAKVIGFTKEKGNEIAELYQELWGKADSLFWERFDDNEYATSYYYEVLD